MNFDYEWLFVLNFDFDMLVSSPECENHHIPTFRYRNTVEAYGRLLQFLCHVVFLLKLCIVRWQSQCQLSANYTIARFDLST